MENTCCVCCKRTYYLGCFDPCGNLTINVDVLVAGDYTLKTGLDGAAIEIVRTHAVGEKLTFPLNCINEGQIYKFKVYDPDGKEMELSSGGEIYDCFSFRAVKKICYGTPLFFFKIAPPTLCLPSEGDDGGGGTVDPPIGLIERIVPLNIELIDGATICLSDILAMNPAYKGISAFDFDLKPCLGDEFNGFVATTSQATSTGDFGNRDLDSGGSFNIPFVQYKDCTFRDLADGTDQCFTAAAGSVTELLLEIII